MTFSYIPGLDGGGLGTTGIAPPGTRSIFLFNSAFYNRDANLRLQRRSKQNVLHTIIHEIGHVFDAQGSGGNPQLYRSQFFVEAWGSSGSSCKQGWMRGCSGTDYNPSGTTSKYGRTSSVEDFAESFAAFVVDKAGGISPITVGPERLAYFSTVIKDLASLDYYH